jgi:DUF917 family protein
MKKLTEQDLKDIIYGCTFLGTGGGGELEAGLNMVLDDYKAGHEFNLISVEDIPDDAMIGSPYNAGSVSPLSEEDIAKFKKYEENPDYNLVAFKALENFLGKKFFATIVTELGGANSAVAFSVAAKSGIAIVDADPAGRSVPELQQSTFQFNNIPINPLSVASKFGDSLVLDKVADADRAEDIVRAIAAASQNTVGVTDHPISGKDLKNSVIKGSISYALEIGKAYREAKEANKDVARTIIDSIGGYILFEGHVSDFDWKDEAGFTFGNVYIEGEDDFEGDKYRVWFKNENLVTWKNDKPHVTGPDLVIIIDKATGLPITNPYHKKGTDVIVVGLVAPKELRTEAAIKEMDPKHFGFDIEYTPIEEIMKE